MARELTATSSPLHYFGAEVRRLRLQLGLSQDELGRQIFQSGDLVRKIEAACRMPSREVVELCDEALNAGGTLRWMWPMLERERQLRSSRSSGRLASEGFHAELTDRPVLDWLLASGVGARHVHADDSLTIEASDRLRRLRQVDHLYGAGQTYPQVVGSLRQDLNDLAGRCPELAIGFLELAGYEAVDLGADGDAQQHYLRALQIATISGDRLYGGYIIAVSLAHLALHCGDPQNAVRLATAAIRGTERQATPAVSAAFRVVLARAHARLGDEATCAAMLRQVENDLERSKPVDEPEWISYFGEADLADERAHCFFDLGRYGDAQREVTTAVGLMDPTRIRRLAIDTALQASSLARSRQIEQACAIGRQAVDHASKTASFRSAHRIAQMMAELHSYANLPAVRDLIEYVRVTLPSVPGLGNSGQPR